jgi:RNA polymerase sigma factor (TIGR02999 family)
MSEDAPNPTSSGEVTQLLSRAREGDADAFERVFPLVYDELRRVAAFHLRGERAGHTLQPTALVNEAYMKLVGGAAPEWQNRAHFVAIAARAMRQVLVDHSRRRSTAKRGGDWQQVTLSGAPLGVDMDAEELLALDEALDRLDALDSRLRQVVEYKFFAGLTDAETAELLGVTSRTAQRDWVKARAWLYKELYPDAPAPGDSE